MKKATSPRKPHGKPLGELALIDLIRTQVTQSKASSIRLGIGDDCAILTPLRHHELLVTTDFSLESRHFLRNLHPPASIGHRCLARGLSDLAAMGAKPLAAFLSIALPASVASDRRWLNSFLAGFQALAALHSVPLAGGDTAESPADLILADICLLGSAPTGKSLRRSTARPGDTLYVTGSLGGAAAELRSLTLDLASLRNPRATQDNPHLYPQPRIAVGQSLLRRSLATACIDLSDGLSTDLTHLCAESNLRAEVDAAALPLHPLCAALSPKARLQTALHGGEDYELLFTAPPSKKIPTRIAGIPITRIGTMLRANKSKPVVTLLEATGIRTALESSGWQHFRSTPAKRKSQR